LEDDMILPLLEPGAVAGAARQAGIPERLERVNLLRVALHHPPVAKIIGGTIDALVLSGVLDERLRELAILRVGWRIGAAYEWGNHYLIARRVGLTDDEITAVREDVPPLGCHHPNVVPSASSTRRSTVSGSRRRRWPRHERFSATTGPCSSW
jgi:hypothetical protein